MRVNVTFTELIIFFFKQKTAYEMRISDWSSDVCSSDLEAMQGPRQPPLPGPERSGCAGRRTFHRRGPRMVNGMLTMRAVSEWKIGRAACRERVCQYV